MRLEDNDISTGETGPRHVEEEWEEAWDEKAIIKLVEMSPLQTTGKIRQIIHI